MEPRYQYNYFISYASEDKKEAKRLKDALTRRGRISWFDDDLDLGAHIGKEVKAGMKASKQALLLLSPSFVDSAWTGFEAWLNLFGDPLNESRRIIPILLDKCEIPDEIEALKHADATGGITEDLVDSIIASS